MTRVPALEGKPLVFTTSDGRKRQIGVIDTVEFDGKGIKVSATVDDEVAKRVLKSRAV